MIIVTLGLVSLNEGIITTGLRTLVTIRSRLNIIGTRKLERSPCLSRT